MERESPSPRGECLARLGIFYLDRAGNAREIIGILIDAAAGGIRFRYADRDFRLTQTKGSVHRDIWRQPARLAAGARSTCDKVAWLVHDDGSRPDISVTILDSNGRSWHVQGERGNERVVAERFNRSSRMLSTSPDAIDLLLFLRLH